MSSLHEPSLSKVRVIIGYILTILPSGMIVFSGINKIIGTEMMINAMTVAQLVDHITFVGVLEILCVILFWIPRTSNLGFALLASYIGGIIAIEWSHFGDAQLGVILAALLYIGTYLRKPSLSGLGI